MRALNGNLRAVPKVGCSRSGTISQQCQSRVWVSEESGEAGKAGNPERVAEGEGLPASVET